MFRKAILAAATAPFMGERVAKPAGHPTTAAAAGAGGNSSLMRVCKSAGSVPGLVAAAAGHGGVSRQAGAAGPSPGVRAAMRAIHLTLLEVALALRHLHSLNLVHCGE